MRARGVAVIGTGFIGPVHVEALRRLGQNVLGILASSPEKGRFVASTLNVPRAYASLDELLADRQVEVVHVTSPNRHHFEQCRRIIAAGKHVICEKPLAMTSRETAQLVALARESQLVTAVNYNVRFYPLCLESRQRCQSNGVGDIYHVTGSYLQDWLLHPTDYNWRVSAKEGGELRAVADIGTHWLDLVTFITGLEVQEVCADLRTVHPVRLEPAGPSDTFSATDPHRTAVPVKIATEDYGSVLLRFRNGASGAFTVSQVTAGRKNCVRFDIAGARASLAWNSEEPNTLVIGYRGRPNELLLRDPAVLAPAVRTFASYPGGHAEGFPDTFKQLFRAVYDAIDGQAGCIYPTFADGHREVVLCEAILRSHRSRRWESVPEGATDK